MSEIQIKSWDELQEAIDADSWRSELHRFRSPYALDWSFSPFLALHFITQDLDQYDRYGAIWVVNYNEAHRFLPQEPRSELVDEGSGVFTVEMLNHAARSLDGLGRKSSSIFAIFFEPPSLD
jgi:hypothetical protein